MSSVSFANNNSAFFITLKRKVDNYFKENKIKSTGNIHLYLKTTILFTLTAATYTALVFFPVNAWLSMGLCVFLGFLFAAIGFGVMHDGAHGSYSNKRWLNEFAGNSLHILGGSTFLWKAKHNVNHHSYTNIEGMDDDIDVKPWLRLHEDQPKKWFHRFQHIYWTFLYGLTYITWIYLRDFVKYFTGKIAHLPFKKMKTSEHIAFWGWKVLYTAVFIALPIYKLGVAETLIGYSILCFVTGWVISVVFQLAHIVEGANFPVPDEANKMEDDWVVHQIKTTANFATKNKLVSWYVGGLNYQIEHHIFPRISHVHYPQVSKIVKETCHEFNIPYNEFPTVISAVKSHAKFLKEMGAN